MRLAIPPSLSRLQTLSRQAASPHTGPKNITLANHPLPSRPAALKPRGNRQIAPKKQSLITQKKLLKKHTGGLTALTEKSLAQRAGHLEILKGGKKDAKEAAAAKKK